MDACRAIKEVCEAKGISQADLCRLSGQSDSYVSLVFQSKIANPQFNRVAAMAKAIGVSLDELASIAQQYPDVTPAKKKGRA